MAEEKAGIITPGRPAVVGPVAEGLWPVIDVEGAEPLVASAGTSRSPTPAWRSEAG